MPKFIDIAGQRFGRLTVLRISHVDKRYGSYWVCQCDCGKENIVRGTKLNSGHTKSCGCLHVESATKILTRHGRHNSLEYNSWRNMRARCSDPKNKNASLYLEKGIRVCERWNTFENFFADMGERPSLNHSIELKDNSKGYEPCNCIWATSLEQARNKCTVKLSVVKAEEIRSKSANGISRIDLALEFGVSKSAIESVVNGRTWRNE